MNKYKANFLWPAEDGSIEFMLYEFANARTEEYRKLQYDIIKTELSQLRDERDKYYDGVQNEIGKNIELEAERDRLRGALEKIRDYEYYIGRNKAELCLLFRRIARGALENSK